MAICTKGAERKLGRRVEEEAHEITTVAFQAYDMPLEMVTSFKYLGKVITTYDDWLEVVAKIWKAWSKWARFSRILGR